MWWAPGIGRIVEGPPGPLEQDAPGQRVAVRAQAGRRQADEHVAGLDVLAGDQLVALGHPDREPDEVELARLHGARVLGHLAADQRAAGLAAALGHAFDELLDVVGVEPTDRDVVEEEERLGPLAHEVVDAHGHQVDADGVEPAGGLGHQRLGADPVGGRHEHRAGGSGLASKPNSPPNPPMSPMTSGRNVDRTLALMRSTASSPAEMLTPAPS